MQNNNILAYLRTLKLNPDYRVFEEIGLFGSYAKQKADIFSDIDVAVKVDKNYLETHDVWDYFDAINAIKEGIFKKFHIKSDVFDVDSISPLKKEIMKDIIYV